MITSQDIRSMNVAELRKEAQKRGFARIQGEGEGRDVVELKKTRKPELIKALLPLCEPEIKVLEIEMFKLSEEETVEIKAALEVSKMSLLELTKAGLLMKARRINTDYEKVSSMSSEERRNTTLSGAANANLRSTADRIVQWNHAQYNNDLRVYLNASILRNLTGSNLNTIKDFLSVYRTPDEFLHTSDEHNQHYGLTDKDNRKGRDEFGSKIKISELIKQPLPQKPEKQEAQTVEEKPTPQPIEEETLSPQKQFAQRIDQLKSDVEIKIECEKLMEELIKANGSKSFSNLKKMVTPYREEVESLRLHGHNTYTHKYQNPRSPETFKGDIPKGAERDDEGNVKSEPRHVALKYLSPEVYRDRFAK